jgi:hypothetical protein
MIWEDLESRFWDMMRHGDPAASWRFSPDVSRCEDWTIETQSEELAAELDDAFELAGDMLAGALSGTAVFPPRLFLTTEQPRACWLRAIRNRGIHVTRPADGDWRVDQGSIVQVVSASMKLCRYLAASPTAQRAGAGSFEGFRKSADKAAPTEPSGRAAA